MFSWHTSFDKRLSIQKKHFWRWCTVLNTKEFKPFYFYYCLERNRSFPKWLQWESFADIYEMTLFSLPFSSSKTSPLKRYPVSDEGSPNERSNLPTSLVPMFSWHTSFGTRPSVQKRHFLMILNTKEFIKITYIISKENVYCYLVVSKTNKIQYYDQSECHPWYNPLQYWSNIS